MKKKRRGPRKRRRRKRGEEEDRHLEEVAEIPHSAYVPLISAYHCSWVIFTHFAAKPCKQTPLNITQSKPINKTRTNNTRPSYVHIFKSHQIHTHTHIYINIFQDPDHNTNKDDSQLWNEFRSTVDDRTYS